MGGWRRAGEGGRMMCRALEVLDPSSNFPKHKIYMYNRVCPPVQIGQDVAILYRVTSDLNIFK